MERPEKGDSNADKQNICKTNNFEKYFFYPFRRTQHNCFFDLSTVQHLFDAFVFDRQAKKRLLLSTITALSHLLYFMLHVHFTQFF